MPCVVLGVRVKRLPGAPIPAGRHKRAREDMLPKPPECRGCPAYGDGQGFVPDEMKPGTQVAVIAQGPGADEEAGRRYLGSNQWEPHPHAPLIGKTGRVFEHTFLPLAGLDRSEVSLGNIVRCRWNHKDTLPPLNQKVVQAAIAHCSRAHLRIPESTKVVVAMGEYAFYGLTGLQHDFNGWRGYLAPLSLPGEPRVPMTGVWTPGRTPGDRLPVFVTYHIARLFREPEAELPTKRDWNKLAYILAGKWPEPMPPLIAEPPDPWPSYAAFDTEFAEDLHDRLIRYSLATRDRKVWVVEASRAGVAATLPNTTVIMHNAPADLPHLRGLIDLGRVDVEDTMYAHAVLWTGRVETDDQKGKQGSASSHTLNFLGSIYSKINRWKHLARIAPRQYAGGDALGTMDAWATGLHGGLSGELARDPQTKWVYENLQKPLIPIIMKAHQRGIATDQEAARAALVDIKREQERFELRAQAYAGWPLNLRSPAHVAFWLYNIEQIKVRRRA